MVDIAGFAVELYIEDEVCKNTDPRTEKTRNFRNSDIPKAWSKKHANLKETTKAHKSADRIRVRAELRQYIG